MPVSLQNLRLKIAAAAMLKQTAATVTALPGGTRAVTSLGRWAAGTSTDEPTGSYRGILAQLLERAAPTQPAPGQIGYDPVAGLVPGPGEPQRPLEQVRAAAESRPTAGNHLALASAYRKPHVADYARAKDHYIEAFTRNPQDLRAAHGIYNTGARSNYDWPQIWRYVRTLVPSKGRLRAPSSFWARVEPLFTAAPTAQELEAALAELDRQRDELPSLHQFLLDALAGRLQTLGCFREGSRLREAMAKNRLRELRGIPLDSATWVKQLAGASAYLGDEPGLQRLMRRPRVAGADASERLRIEKLQADSALFAGDAAPLVEHVRRRAEQLPLAGEETFRELVEGRRVAVVGPAATSDVLGETIDSYDVVVRTQFRQDFLDRHAQRVGTRTDVAYYSGRDLNGALDTARAAVEEGRLQAVVARPSYLPTVPQRPDWLRLARTEFALYFRGAPLAVPRIIYDLLQFAPAEIGLFHADFYTGQEPFAGGYRDEDQVFGPGSAMNDVAVVHDLLFEFRTTQRFLRTGLVTPHGAAAEVLGLTEEEYLQRLETTSWLSGARPGAAG